MAVPLPRDDKRPQRRRVFARVTIVVLALGAVVAPAPLLPTQPANAATVSSSLTVSWFDDTSSAKDDQPPRDPDSPHFNEMRNIKVTVSQTKDIIDQAIRVEVSGFAGTRAGGLDVVNGQNFMQAMQCWGEDPNDLDPELDYDFVETCQWGGRIPVVLGNSVYFDNNNRVSSLDYDPRTVTDFDNPFRPVYATSDDGEISGKGELITEGNPPVERTFSPLLSLFGPATTNEVPVARIGSDRTGYFDFETQSSIQAPHMGCGTPENLRCWLVLVPRGTKFGGDGRECSDLVTRNGDYYGYGDTTPIQGGSPVNPKCDYFDNRIVIPLDFTPTGASCPPGSREFRVSGSQFMIAAMSSWQPALCKNISSTFSFSTNPDSIARTQLLDDRAGTPELIYSGYPISSGELKREDQRTLLTKTATQYAPVAISSVVVAYNAEFANGRPGSLNLTPRLMAKLLTQSYTFTVPSSTSYAVQSVAHLSAQARTYNYFNADPDFREANPTNWQQYDQQFPSIVLPGPAGGDGIKQVWRWILADQDAVDFLNGEEDPWGMTINPYYLPKTTTTTKNVIPWFYDAGMNYLPVPTTKLVGALGVDGGPFSLSSAPLETFPKDDGTLLPFETSNENGKTRYDSIQFAPYAADYLSAARQAFRGDPNSKTYWDGAKYNDDGSFGAWVSRGVQDAGARFMIAVTDSANAARYGLTTAALTPANTTSPVASTPATMAAALSALTPTSLDTVRQVDPAKVGAGAYPLTMVTYAGVNLTKSTAASRETMSRMLTQITTTGQVAGTARGELPAGYLPLTSTLQDQATAAAAAILAWKPPAATTTTTNTNTNTNNNAPTQSGQDGLVDPTADGGTDPELTTGVDVLTDERTPASSSSPIERSSLAIALIVALLGFIAGPLILRRRGFLP